MSGNLLVVAVIVELKEKYAHGEKVIAKQDGPMV
jgi:hypothetical protein